MPRSFGFFCPITPYWKIHQATSVTINDPMNFPATPAWTLGPVSSTVLSLLLHIRPCLYLIVFSCSSSFPSQRQYSQRIHPDLFSQWLHPLQPVLLQPLLRASPSTSPRVNLQDADLWTVGLPLPLSKFPINISALLLSTRHIPGKVFPTGLQMQHRALFQLLPWNLCSLPKHHHMAMWLPQLVDHTPVALCFPTLCFPPVVPDLSFLLHFCMKVVSPFAVLNTPGEMCVWLVCCCHVDLACLVLSVSVWHSLFLGLSFVWQLSHFALTLFLTCCLLSNSLLPFT